MAETRVSVVRRVLGFGHPILDVTAVVPPEFLAKYHVEQGSVSLAEPNQMGVFDDIASTAGAMLVPGGATMNSCRVARWMLEDAGIASSAKSDDDLVCFVGSIADDEFGKALAPALQSAHIKPILTVIRPQNADSEFAATGCCAVMVNKSQRTMLTRLGAARALSTEDIDSSEVRDALSRCGAVYFEGFFLNVMALPTGHLKIARKVSLSYPRKSLWVNISAPFLCGMFKEHWTQLLPYVDMLIGSHEDAAGLGADVFGLEIEDIDVEDDVESGEVSPAPPLLVSEESLLVHSSGESDDSDTCHRRAFPRGSSRVVRVVRSEENDMVSFQSVPDAGRTIDLFKLDSAMPPPPTPPSNTTPRRDQDSPAYSVDRHASVPAALSGAPGKHAPRKASSCEIEFDPASARIVRLAVATVRKMFALPEPDVPIPADGVPIPRQRSMAYIVTRGIHPTIIVRATRVVNKAWGAEGDPTESREAKCSSCGRTHWVPLTGTLRSAKGQGPHPVPDAVVSRQGSWSSLHSEAPSPTLNHPSSPVPSLPPTTPCCELCTKPHDDDAGVDSLGVGVGVDGVAVAVEVFHVPVVRKKHVVDDCGAGDAFVGGFLSAWVRDLGIRSCVAAGHYAASTVVQVVGCRFPPHHTFNPPSVQIPLKPGVTVHEPLASAPRLRYDSTGEIDYHSTESFEGQRTMATGLYMAPGGTFTTPQSAGLLSFATGMDLHSVSQGKTLEQLKSFSTFAKGTHLRS